MASLANHASSEYVKLLLIGDSGSGKTGALTPLVRAGYKLRIADYDNGLDALRNHVLGDCPDKVGNVDFETVLDNLKADRLGRIVSKGAPRAFTKLGKLIDKWPDESIPSEWGADTIFVLDSLTAVGRAAFRWAQAMLPSSKDPRQWYNLAQDAIYGVVEALTGEEFRTNLIVISHIDYVDSDGGTKGYVSSIGKALGPKLPSRFNTILGSRIIGSGSNVKRTIQTLPTSTLDLKNPAPMRMSSKPYPIESGLADIFNVLKGN